MNKFFKELRGKLGFGLMRLPMIGNEVDYNQVSEMVDEFIAKGFNYFDTAHGYIDGKSEIAVNKCISSRYKRNEFLLTNKLTENYFDKEEDIRPFFYNQLKTCGVEYFDFYLMHAQNRNNFKHYKKCNAYETAIKLKEEGKIKHLGISFHDTNDILDQILTEYPEIEVVQIQLNYLDYEDPEIQSRLCYDVCVKHNKPVLIMEPVKGGKLAFLPNEAENVFNKLGNSSYASYAIRFAASLDQVVMVLSGMSNISQMNNNLSYMADFKKINAVEAKAIKEVVQIFKNIPTISCTNCKYCVEGCPKHIPIPMLFKDYNNKKLYKNYDGIGNYKRHTENKGKASDCIKCGKCEYICPQHLKIRDLLVEVKETFE